MIEISHAAIPNAQVVEEVSLYEGIGAAQCSRIEAPAKRVRIEPSQQQFKTAPVLRGKLLFYLVQYALTVQFSAKVAGKNRKRCYYVFVIIHRKGFF